MVGVVGYGFYIPKYRIKTTEIAKTWHKNAEQIESSLRVTEKSVAGFDEDSLTMGFEASNLAIKTSKIDKEQIQAIFFGSETPPYAVNPASTVIGEFLGIENQFYLSYDTQFACKAATGAMVSAFSLVETKRAKYALVCGSDKANSKPGDALEFTAGSGAVSFILGSNPSEIALELVDTLSISTDTPDFWRRNGTAYPSHAGRFTGQPAYFYHIQTVTEEILKRNKLQSSDFTFAGFHMPNGKFPLQIAKKLGFDQNQISDSLVVNYLGNSYSASGLMGLCAILEKVKSGNLIYFCSYGSGSGSDAFIFKVNKNIDKIRQPFMQITNQKEYIDYTTYRNFIGNLK